jgi:hypothetical protein
MGIARQWPLGYVLHYQSLNVMVSLVMLPNGLHRWPMHSVVSVGTQFRRSQESSNNTVESVIITKLQKKSSKCFTITHFAFGAFDLWSFINGLKWKDLNFISIYFSDRKPCNKLILNYSLRKCLCGTKKDY